MACAIPVIISDQVKIHEEVSKIGAGLVTRCEADEVASAINILLQDPERRNKLGVAGRELVRKKYCWDAIVPELTNKYEAILERHIYA